MPQSQHPVPYGTHAYCFFVLIWSHLTLHQHHRYMCFGDKLNINRLKSYCFACSSRPGHSLTIYLLNYYFTFRVNSLRPVHSSRKARLMAGCSPLLEANFLSNKPLQLTRKSLLTVWLPRAKLYSICDDMDSVCCTVLITQIMLI